MAQNTQKVSMNFGVVDIKITEEVKVVAQEKEDKYLYADTCEVL